MLSLFTLRFEAAVTLETGGLDFGDVAPEHAGLWADLCNAHRDCVAICCCRAVAVPVVGAVTTSETEARKFYALRINAFLTC